MKRRDPDRLEDVAEAIAAIRAHLALAPLGEGVVFDAVLYRLIQIGEAVKAVSPELLDHEPDVDWGAAARMRDRLAHRYWDTVHAEVAHIVEHDLEPMLLAARRLEADLAARPAPEG